MTYIFLSLLLLIENVPLGVRISKLGDRPFLMAPSGLQVQVTSLSLTLQKRASKKRGALLNPKAGQLSWILSVTVVK